MISSGDFAFRKPFPKPVISVEFVLLVFGLVEAIGENEQLVTGWEQCGVSCIGDIRHQSQHGAGQFFQPQAFIFGRIGEQGRIVTGIYVGVI